MFRHPKLVCIYKYVLKSYIDLGYLHTFFGNFPLISLHYVNAAVELGGTY